MPGFNSEKVLKDAEATLSGCFADIDDIALQNQKKVMQAFKDCRVSPEYFAERTGYGMDDAGRDVLDSVFAQIYGAESAALRMQMVSGTHALACVLFGNLRAGDRLCSLSGHPYDTMEKVIGLAGNESGTLASLGVIYDEFDIFAFANDDKRLHLELSARLAPPTKMAYIQKSCGYSIERPSLCNNQIERICKLVRKINPNLIIMVDNCYGELVEAEEPTAVGADIIAGSLIKNPGGGLAISGGYFAGKKALVEAALNRLTAPGIGGHLGLSFNQNRLLFQGIYLAPQFVANALKGANLFAKVFSELGFEVFPEPGARRGDIIQAIKFGNQKSLQNFLKTLQALSPVDAHVLPEAADMPGYSDQVLMAGGTFVEGSTIELSADGPLREPYVAYVQGGLSYPHIKLALCGLLEAFA